MSLTVVCARYNEDVYWLAPILDKVVIYNKGLDNLDYIPRDKIINTENIGREGGTYIKHIIDNYGNLSDYILFIQGNPVDHIFPDKSFESYMYIYDIVHEPKDYHFKHISKNMISVARAEVVEYSSGIPALTIGLFPELDIRKILVFLRTNLDKDYKNEIMKLIIDLENLVKEDLSKNISIYDLTRYIRRYAFFMDNSEGNKLRDNLYKLYNSGDFCEMFDKVDYRYGSGAQFIVHKKQILRRPLEFWVNIYESLQELHPPAGYGLEKLWPIIM